MEIVRVIRRGAKNSRVEFGDGSVGLISNQQIPADKMRKPAQYVDRGICDWANRHRREDEANNRRASQDPLYAYELRMIRMQEGW